MSTLDLRASGLKHGTRYDEQEQDQDQDENQDRDSVCTNLLFSATNMNSSGIDIVGRRLIEHWDSRIERREDEVIRDECWGPSRRVTV